MKSNGTFVSAMSGKCLEASTGNELFRNLNEECWILCKCTDLFRWLAGASLCLLAMGFNVIYYLYFCVTYSLFM